MTRAHSRTILILASVYNVTGGLIFIFFLDFVAPLVGFQPRGNRLLELFSGGAMVTFGLAYFHLAKSSTYRAPILFFGASLKYWAFVAALWSYVFSGLSLLVLFGFGVINLCFALLFTLILFAKSSSANDDQP